MARKCAYLLNPPDKRPDFVDLVPVQWIRHPSKICFRTNVVHVPKGPARLDCTKATTSRSRDERERGTEECGVVVVFNVDKNADD